MDHLKFIKDDVDPEIVLVGLAKAREACAGPIGLKKAQKTEYYYKNPQNEFTMVRSTDTVSFMNVPWREFYRVDAYIVTVESGLSATPNLSETIFICKELEKDYPGAKIYPMIPPAEAGAAVGMFFFMVVFTEKTDYPNVA